MWSRRNNISLPKSLVNYCHRVDLLPAVVEAMTKEGLR